MKTGPKTYAFAVIGIILTFAFTVATVVSIPDQLSDFRQGDGFMANPADFISNQPWWVQSALLLILSVSLLLYAFFLRRPDLLAEQKSKIDDLEITCREQELVLDERRVKILAAKSAERVQVSLSKNQRRADDMIGRLKVLKGRNFLANTEHMRELRYFKYDGIIPNTDEAADFLFTNFWEDLEADLQKARPKYSTKGISKEDMAYEGAVANIKAAKGVIAKYQTRVKLAQQGLYKPPISTDNVLAITATKRPQ